MSEASAWSLGFGRIMPGSTILRKVWRRSCSAASWAADFCGGSDRVRRSTASASVSGEMYDVLGVSPSVSPWLCCDIIELRGCTRRR